MKKIQDVSAFIFIICVFVLTVVSILGVWKILDEDVIGKSLKTVGLLAIVSVIVIVAGRFIDSRNQVPVSTGAVGVSSPEMPEINTTFTFIRHFTVVVLITAVSLLAFLGVLAIWDVMSGETLNKSLSSIAIIAFASLIVVITCLQREQHKLMQQKFSGWVLFLVAILGWIFVQTMFSSMFR